MVMARVRTVWTGVAGTPWYTNHYFNPATVDATDLTSDVGEFWSSIVDQITGGVQGTVEAGVAIINPVDGEISAVLAGEEQNFAGANVAGATPPAVQGLLRLETGAYVGGRRIRGRMNIPRVPATSVGTDSGPTDAYRADIIAAAEALLAAQPSWCVWSKKNGNVAEIDSVSVWEQFAVLRSRRD